MTPHALIAALRQTFEQHDEAAFIRLCNEHGTDILEHFGSWLKVPAEIRNDSAAAERFIAPLIALAEGFENAGYPELMEQLTGGADNVVTRWQQAFAAAHQHVAAGRRAEAIEILRQVLPELETATGPAVDDVRPKIYALLGKAFVESGDLAEGTRFMTRARDDCRRAGDQEGARAFGENLRLLAAAAASSSGEERDERLLVVRAAIATAQELSDDAEFAESNTILLELLDDEEMAPALAELRGKVCGLLGLNFFRLADPAQARRYTEQALAHCRQADDPDGVRIYAANLEAIGRT